MRLARIAPQRLVQRTAAADASESGIDELGTPFPEQVSALPGGRRHGAGRTRRVQTSRVPHSTRTTTLLRPAHRGPQFDEHCREPGLRFTAPTWRALQKECSHEPTVLHVYWRRASHARRRVPGRRLPDRRPLQRYDYAPRVGQGGAGRGDQTRRSGGSKLAQLGSSGWSRSGTPASMPRRRTARSRTFTPSSTSRPRRRSAPTFPRAPSFTDSSPRPPPRRLLCRVETKPTKEDPP